MDMELLLSVEAQSQQQLDAVQLEFYEHKVKHMDTTTKMDHDQQNIKELTDDLVKLGTEHAALTKLQNTTEMQRAKLAQRQKALEAEHRDVAQHVHSYYTTINKLEKALAEETARRSDNDE